MFKILDMKSNVTDFNAKAPRREDAKKIENVLAALIVNAAIEVHRTLGGPGFIKIFASLRLVRLCVKSSQLLSFERTLL
jgi:hypothetical protein